jgi:cephalosporin hydroxylase
MSSVPNKSTEVPIAPYFETTRMLISAAAWEKTESPRLPRTKKLRQAAHHFRDLALDRKHMNNFSWLCRPVVQMPCDIIAIQEIIWHTRPDIIVETGLAHGGSLLFHASMLHLLGGGEVVGVDIEIHPHNRKEIEAHPFGKAIRLIEGSSISTAVASQVWSLCAGKKRVMIILDSNHTHDHVLKELELYADLVIPGCYFMMMDTFIEDTAPDTQFPDRPWTHGNILKTAVHAWLKSHPEFAVNRSIEHKLLMSACPDGFLRRVLPEIND